MQWSGAFPNLALRTASPAYLGTEDCPRALQYCSLCGALSSLCGHSAGFSTQAEHAVLRPEQWCKYEGKFKNKNKTIQLKA